MVVRTNLISNPVKVKGQIIRMDLVEKVNKGLPRIVLSSKTSWCMIGLF